MVSILTEDEQNPLLLAKQRNMYCQGVYIHPLDTKT